MTIGKCVYCGKQTEKEHAVGRLFFSETETR